MISQSHVSLVMDELDPYYKQEKPLEEMPDFTEFRLSMERKGINYMMLVNILKYLKSKGAYELEIDKLGNFKINEFDI
ncbi:hypothetical protein [Piscibacillus salipiscarius]|uniref:Uncharacterized protein n=1 Tax=Piscibacillus salipiscarius TaxID=299480 RepID=A0ABW5QDE3_9BACI|nr:hypothetical protein [Piscibacillus salipiscarius]